MHLQPCATAEIRTDAAASGAARATPWRPRGPARAARDPGRAKPAVAVGAALPPSTYPQNHRAAVRNFFSLKVRAVISFAGLVGMIIFLSEAKIISFEMAILMLVALLGMYLGFGILIAVYRLITKLE